jgi:hypothetical protein
LPTTIVEELVAGAGEAVTVLSVKSVPLRRGARRRTPGADVEPGALALAVSGSWPGRASSLDGV